MTKSTLLGILLIPFCSLSQHHESVSKNFTEKLEGINASKKELTKNASTDNSSIGQGGAMTNSIPLITVSSRNMTFPLQLNYAAGIKVNQQSGPVGLGWALPIGSIKRDFGSYYPDYSSTSHEADMYNVQDEGQSTQTNKGKFYTRIGTGPQAIQGTYLDPAVQQKYLGFGTIAADETRNTPLSDMYHISVPGKISNSFFNNGTIGGDHEWRLTETENWKITHDVKTYKVSQEFSRINETNLVTYPANALMGSSYASAIGVLPYVKNGFAKIPSTFSESFSATEIEGQVHYEDFKFFVITDENGTKYVFGRALRGQRFVFNDDPYWSNNPGTEPGASQAPNKGSFWKIDYIAEWLLTEIQSVDYEDSNNNGFADDGDAGDWIRFEYTDPIKSEPAYLGGSCFWFEQEVPKYREWSSFSQTDRASSLMRELAYLQKIVTPTQEIDFTISERYDVEHDYFTKPANRVGNDYYYEDKKLCPTDGSTSDFDINYPVETMKYDQISIKSRLISPELYPNENLSIGTIKFNYAAKGSAQELAVSSYLIRNNDKLEKIASSNGKLVGSPTYSSFNIGNFTNTTDKRGKTTLLGLEFYGSTVSASEKNEYKFEYAYNPSFDEFHKREIARAYFFPSVRQGSSSNNHVLPYSKADAYVNYSESVFTDLNASSNVNRTNMSAYDFLIDFPYKEIEYVFVASTNITSYVNGGETSQNGNNLNANARSHGVNPIMDMYGYFYIPNKPNASTAWSLTKITYPTGGEVSFTYEPAAFVPSLAQDEWSIKPTNLPIITRYNEIAKRRSFIQDAYNRYYASGYYPNTGLFPKHLTPTFEIDLPLNYGIRLKEKVTNDKINPTVTLRYEYENGTFTSAPSEFVQNALSGFNHFITRENHLHSLEYEKYYNISDPNWDYDFAEKMSEICHTNISLDDYSSTFFYKKIRTIGADNSYVEKEYGSALSTNIEFPKYNLYCYIMKAGSFWQGSYVLGGDNLIKSPISLKSEALFEPGASAPYQKKSYTYQRFQPLFYQNIRFFYGGYANGPGAMTLWDVHFDYYRPFTNNNTPPQTLYQPVPNLTTSSYCEIGQSSATDVESNSNTYPKWVSSKLYMQTETTNYKGIISTVQYIYNEAPNDQKIVLREVKKETLNEPLSYVTRYQYAFEEYTNVTSKFRDLNLFALPYRTTTYLNNSAPANTLSDQVITYDLNPIVPRALDTYSYETTSINPTTGTFTPTSFSTTDANWRVEESDIYEYNQAGVPVSTRSNQIYNKAVTGNGSTNVKATISGTERPFDATYTGFEDLKSSYFPEDWNPSSYLKEDWFGMESTNQEIVTKVNLTDVTPPCASNYSTLPVYYIISTDDISALLPGKTVDFSYTTGGNTYTYPLTVSNTYPTIDYPQIVGQNTSILDYFVCFQSAPSFSNFDPDNIVSKIVIKIPTHKVSSSYSRTGKYSYKLPSIRTTGIPAKQTPIRPVKIASMTPTSECNYLEPEEPGDGQQSRNPSIPATCYWDYTASLWLKYDTDIPPLNPSPVASTPFSDDALADAIYRRGDVSTSNVTGVRIVCKVWNGNRTHVNEEFVFYPQDLNAAWKQYTVDFSIFKGPEQWVDVYVENTNNQVGVPILQYKSAFVDDIIIAPKEAKYDYSVTDPRGNTTFEINNNDVFVQTAYDTKGRIASTRNAYGKVQQELTYFDQANWTSSHNYVTEVKWVSNGLFNTTRYFMDGFARTKQVQSSDHVRNMRAVSETNIYNNKGQIIQSYKPYYLSQYGLDSKYDPTYAAKTQTLYGSNNAFTEVTFEAKPEPVVATVKSPRTDAESPIISSQTEYINTTALSHVSTDGTNTFPAATLLVNQTVNPVGKITRTYLNRLGQVIMEEHQIGMEHIQNADGSISFNTNDLGFAQTWFYYDGAGRIAKTYDPENKKTEYFYNSLGVMVKTISPDKGTSELRYDKYGQIRFTRDQKDIEATDNNNIYSTSQFKYIKYDKWGQVIESGAVTVAPGSLNVSTTNPPFPTGNFFNDYTKINDQDYPKTTDKFVQVHIKNNYTGNRKFYSSTGVTEQFAFSQHVLNTSTFTYSPTKTDQVSKTFMADGQPAKTTYAYDGLAGTHQILAVYNDMNLPIGKDYTNSVNSGSNFKWRTAIDIYGRAVTNTTVYNAVDNQVSKNYYDPLGNLLLVGLGKTASTSDPHLDYLSIKKNIREQLVSQMSKNYRVGLTYDMAGNVTNQYWSNEKIDPSTSSSAIISQYAYSYDKMNRLIGADFKQTTMASNPFTYYATLNANIPSDFACTLDGEVVALAFRSYYAEFENNIANRIDENRSRSSINALNQLQSDYMRNNVQYADMSTTQIDDFFNLYIGNCNRNRITPTDFEYYQAEKVNDNTHIDYLKNNPVNPKSFKYMRVILGGMPWTPPVNCMPNPNATAYGYLQNFPTPTAPTNPPKYDAAYWYEKNGNFRTLNRNDQGTTRTIQSYTYQPGTNMLTQVGFTPVVNSIPQATTNVTYTYDKNGNLEIDPRNSVTAIAYSLFDELPISITNTGGQHNYRYFGGARSVKEITSTDREYYIDQVILDQNGTVKSYQTAAGYAIPNGSTANYFYQVKDWLGSPHITFNSSGSVLNGTDYYPYGKPMPGRSTYGTNYEGYRYQFTSHERDGETNYQYHGARYYNEELARYMSVDPWAAKYHNWSTYNYAMSNPLTFIDPTGKGVEYSKDEAMARAARGVTNGYDTKVVANPNKKDDYGVVYKKTIGGKTYKGVQYDGKFTGIGSRGLVGNNSGLALLTGSTNSSSLPTLPSLSPSISPYITAKYKVQKQEEETFLDGVAGDKVSVVNIIGKEQTVHKGKNSILTASVTKTIGGSTSYSVGSGPFTMSISGTVTTLKVALPFTNTTLDVGAGPGVGLGELQVGTTTTNPDGVYGGTRLVLRPGGGTGLVAVAVAGIILTDGAAAPIILPILKSAF